MTDKYTCKFGHTGEPYIGTDGYRRCMECKRDFNKAYRASRPKIYARNRDLKSFSGIRETVIQRDGERCVKCGMPRDEHKERYSRDITVDHIDGNGRNSPRPLKNNDLNNLQTLCLSCHSTKDNLRRSYANASKKRTENEL